MDNEERRFDGFDAMYANRILVLRIARLMMSGNVGLLSQMHHTDGFSWDMFSLALETLDRDGYEDMAHARSVARAAIQRTTENWERDVRETQALMANLHEKLLVTSELLEDIGIE
jgi:hypothetical protein